VYFTNNTTGLAARVPKSGGTVTTLAQAENLLDIALDATNVYWLVQAADAVSASIHSVPK
jgi:hypothetical protein